MLKPLREYTKAMDAEIKVKKKSTLRKDQKDDPGNPELSGTDDLISRNNSTHDIVSNQQFVMQNQY